MAVPLKKDATALGGSKVEPARSMQRLKAAKHSLSESIGSSIPKLDSNSKAAIAALGKACPVPLYMETNHVQSISVTKKAEQKPASKPEQVKQQSVTPPPKKVKASKKKVKQQKVESSHPPAEAKPASDSITGADVRELCYHISQGDVRGAKSYLEYHFDGDKAAEQEWVSANADELLGAAIALEPTNYSPDGDPEPMGWSEYETVPVTVELTYKPKVAWKRVGNGLRPAKPPVKLLNHVRPKGYDDWLELNTPITRKHGGPVVTWLNTDKSVCAMRVVTSLEPVMLGKLELYRTPVRQAVMIPHAVSQEVMVDHVNRRIGGYKAAYGSQYEPSAADLAIITAESKPVVNTPVAANDSEVPPWVEPDREATFYHHVQNQRVINAFYYEGHKWKEFFTAVGQDLRQKRNERIRNVFEMSMSEANVVATTAPKPAEHNLQDDVALVNTGYMDDDSVVYVDSEEELDVLERLASEFQALSLWDRGELKVQAADAGTDVPTLMQKRKDERRDILTLKHQFNAGYRGQSRMNNVAAAALEQQRYDTWFLWATAGDVYYDRLADDTERYEEYWDARWMNYQWEYQYALDRVNLQQHLEGMESIKPSKRYIPLPEDKAGARAAPESVVPAGITSHTNLNVPEDPQRKERSIVREILEAGNLEVGFELKPFVEALKQPVVDLNMVRQYADRFQPTEGGTILMPT